MSDDLFEWRERIGVQIMHAMKCTHEGADFGDRAVCVTCFGNTQRIGALVEAERERIVAAVEAIHGRTHWCFTKMEEDELFEPGQRWPCPTLAALTSAAPDALARMQAEALREFADKWAVWVAQDAPQIRGGAAYRARAEADRIARGES